MGYERVMTPSQRGTEAKGIIQQGATVCGCTEFFYMLLKVAAVRPFRVACIEQAGGADWGEASRM